LRPVHLFAQACMALTACSALGACSQSEVPATQLLLKVWPSADETTVFTRIDVSVSDPGASDRAAAPASRFYVARPGASKRAGEVTLPFSVGIVRTSANKVRIAVSGYAKNEEGVVRVVERKIDTRFQNERTVSVDVTLDAICVGEGAVCADDDATCYALAAAGVEAGRCGPVPFLQGEVTPAGTEPAGPPVESDSALPVETTVAGDASIDADGEPEVIEGGADHSTMADAAADDASTSLDLVAIDPGFPLCDAQMECTANYPCVRAQPTGHTCLGQFADWPMPSEPSFGGKYRASYANDTLNDLVEDKVTNLVWAPIPPASYEGCSGSISGGGKGDSCTQNEARRFCSNVDLGNGKARLPTKIDLESLIDEGRPRIALDKAAFPIAQGGVYWTSSPYADPSYSEGWVVDLSSGDSRSKRQDEKHLVRCVRSIAPPTLHAEGRYRTDSAARAISDLQTSLTWQASDHCGINTFEEAESLCSVAGNGFRLPTRKELLTIVDPTRTSPAIPGIFSTASNRAALWTASPVLDDNGMHWFVLIGDGSTVPESALRKPDGSVLTEVMRPLCVRCVR